MVPIFMPSKLHRKEGEVKVQNIKSVVIHTSHPIINIEYN
jgi:hypothetical protein